MPRSGRVARNYREQMPAWNLAGTSLQRHQAETICRDIYMDKQIEKTLSLVHTVKRVFTLALMLLMLLVVSASVLELGIIIYQELTDPAKGIIFLEIHELLHIFGFFFLILIGVELLETVEMYFRKNTIHAEIVLMVAIIAVARKVILLDLTAYDPVSIIGLALIIVALGVSYYLLKRAVPAEK